MEEGLKASLSLRHIVKLSYCRSRAKTYFERCLVENISFYICTIFKKIPYIEVGAVKAYAYLLASSDPKSFDQEIDDDQGWQKS